MRNFFLFPIMTLILFSCENAEKNWEKAEQAGTKEAYEEHLKKYPTSPFKEKAQHKIISLDFDRSSKSNTVEAYDEFLKKYPKVTLARTALERKLLLIFGRKIITPPQLDSQDIQSIKRFASAQLYGKKREEEVYNELLKNDMYYEYIAFLELFPKSSHRRDIESQIKRFGQFASSKKERESIPYEILQRNFFWNGKEDLYRWGDYLAMAIRDPDTGEKIIEGPMCVGNLQFTNGGFIYVEGGLKFLKGTKIIFPLKKGFFLP